MNVLERKKAKIPESYSFRVFLSRCRKNLRSLIKDSRFTELALYYFAYDRQRKQYFCYATFDIVSLALV